MECWRNKFKAVKTSSVPDAVKVINSLLITLPTAVSAKSLSVAISSIKSRSVKIS